MTMIVAYDQICKALAEANSVKEVLQIRDGLDHVKLHARKIRDKVLLEEAIIAQMRTERELGVRLAALKEDGKIAEGRRKKDADPERITLEEIGVDRKLSFRAQKSAAMADDDFRVIEDEARQKVRSGRAILVDPLDQGGPINGARSIMGSRAEPDDSLDYFPTPPWATRALVERVLKVHGITLRGGIREPACGEGHIAEVLREYGLNVTASDIFDYGYADEILDYLSTDLNLGADWIITNPPFDEKALAFVELALTQARVGVAMFFRSQWAVEGLERYQRLFSVRPPTIVAFFTERVNLCKGRWDPDGSTATAYCWLVWHHGAEPRPTFWIPPGCREGLSKPDDVERFTARPVMKRVLEAA